MRETTVLLQCDGPGCVATRQGHRDETAGALRERLAVIGWRGRGDRDICENCMAKGHRP